MSNFDLLENGVDRPTERPSERYDRPPSAESYRNTEATHFVHFVWDENWDEENWQSSSHLVRRDLSGTDWDIVTKDCAILYSDLPNLESSTVVARLSHKSLVNVIRERVGPSGLYHYVRVTNTNPSVDGLEGYINYEHLTKLPGIAPSLPVTFRCIKQHDKNRDFCSITSTNWHSTTEPYLDTFDCNYKINVVTGYSDTGDGSLKQRMQEQIPRGVQELLVYYDKERSPEQLQRLLGAFRFAEATSWNLDLQDQGSRLKVLVTVPARYFDAIPDASSKLSSVGDGVVRSATLESSNIDRRIERLAKKMRSWHRSSSWEKSKSLYSGPEPFYKEYSFSEEASRLEAFLSGLRRLLALNRKSIRARSNDTIEIGMDAEYKLSYVLVNDDSGTHRMKIGINKLKQMEPFNHQRTMAYIFYLYEISNEFKRSNGIKGGWPVFLKKYTFPPPNQQPASKKKKCKPTIKDPFKCMPKEFQDFAKGHLNNVKCEDLPAEMRTTPMNLGSSEINMFYEALESGEWSNYEDRFAKVRTQAENIISKKSIKEFKEQIRRENQQFDGSYDFVGDPFVESLDKRLQKYGSEEYAEEFENKLFDKFMKDVVVKVDIKGAISTLHQCLCDELQRQVDILINNLQDRDHPAVRAAELTASAAGCGNPCQVLPILCSCLPIPWPLKFDLPAKFSIPDIMRYLTAAIIDAIISAAFKFLLDLIKAIISETIKCDRSSDVSRDFKKQFELNYPFAETNFSKEEIEDTLSKNEMPSELVDIDKINSLITETVLLLTPREFCNLISGEPSLSAIEAVSFLINERYPDFKENFSTHEKIKTLYSSIGDMIDPDICRNLDQILDSVPIEPGNYICDETNLRSDIASGKATREQIGEIMIEASKCSSEKLETITNLTRDLVAGNSIMGALMPELIKTPANPGGIIPRDPPPVLYMTNLANDSIFKGVERRFYTEMNSHVPTLITTKQIPRGTGEGFVKFFEDNGFAGEGDADLQKSLGKTIADGLGEILTYEAVRREDYVDTLNLASLDIPSRSIYPSVTSEQNFSLGDNLYELFPIPGFSNGSINQDLSPPIRQESLRVEYNICGETVSSVNFSSIRDAYSVRIQDTQDATRGPLDLMTFDGKKKIKDNILALYEDFITSGEYSPSRELLSVILSNKWASLSGAPDSLKDKLKDPTYGLNKFHANTLFQFETNKILSRLAKIFSKSRLLDSRRVDFLPLLGNATTFDEAFENLRSIRFSPDLDCEIKEPGLLNLDDVMSKVFNYYNNDLQQDPSIRYVNSSNYGVIMLIVRVICIHEILNSVFTFAQFRAENILESELMVHYLLSKFRKEIATQTFVNHPNFYEELRSTIGVLIAQRKFVEKEDFADPFTNEPVDVRLDPRYVMELVQSTQHDPTGLIETIDLEELDGGELDYNPNGLDSVLNCYIAGVDQREESVNECVPQTESDALNETSDGTPVNSGNEEILNDTSVAQQDMRGGKTPVGFMEFFVKEQLKAISGELEVLLGTEINDIDQYMINGISRTTDVQSFYAGDGFDPRPQNRLFLQSSRREGSISLAAVAESELREIYEVYKLYLETGSYDTNFFSRLSRMHRRGEISDQVYERYMSPRNITVENRNRNIIRDFATGAAVGARAGAVTVGGALVGAFVGGFVGASRGERRRDRDRRQEYFQDRDEVFALLMEDLQSLFVPTSQQRILNNKFDYLQNGGFITERYVRVRDLSEQEWNELIDNPNTPETKEIKQLLKEKILGRHGTLKGVVSLQDWYRFNSDLADFLVNQTISPYDNIRTINPRVAAVILRKVNTWYKSVKFGKRMCYVYPLLEGLSGDGDQVQYLPQLKEAINTLQRDMLKPEFFDQARREKTFISFESVQTDFSVTNITETGDSIGKELSVARDYIIFTVPVVSAEMELTLDSFRGSGFDSSDYDSFNIYDPFNNMDHNPYVKMYEDLFEINLTNQILNKDEYKAIFDYIFPLDRFVSLLTIYTAEYVAGLPGRKELFDGTKELLYNMYEALRKSLSEEWWHKEERRFKKWEKPLDLSVPGILFMTPWKILQALLTLVPPLDWFLGKLKDRIPALPPYRRGKEEPCPEDRAER